MSFKTLFVPMAFERTAPTIMDAALLLAASFGAHVHAHHVRQRYSGYPPIDFFPSDGAAATVMQEGHDEATAVFARAIRAIFEESCDTVGAKIVPVSEALKQNGVTASWTEEVGFAALHYSLAARIADLVVIATPDPKAVEIEREIFEATLMKSGAPIFLTPRAGLGETPKRPLIAWDGSLQASRVVRGALALLVECEEATLLTIGDTDHGTPSLDSAKHWLERNGVRVATRSVDWPRGPVAERILNQCEALNSDLVVMGGYSHSRIRESMFGGVTLHMLHHAELPLLMIH